MQKRSEFRSIETVYGSSAPTVSIGRQQPRVGLGLALISLGLSVSYRGTLHRFT